TILVDRDAYVFDRGLQVQRQADNPSTGTRDEGDRAVPKVRCEWQAVARRDALQIVDAGLSWLEAKFAVVIRLGGERRPPMQERHLSGGYGLARERRQNLPLEQASFGRDVLDDIGNRHDDRRGSRTAVRRCCAGRGRSSACSITCSPPLSETK